MGEKVLNGCGIVFIVLFVVMLGGCSIMSIIPSGRAFLNNWNHELKKVDEATDYRTLKKVEDTCRAMISSYESDRLIYEQHKGSESKERQTWAEEAKMRANRTAATYNEYILKNDYVWQNNVPNDIYMNLEYLE